MKWLISAFVLCFAGVAHAGFYIEPGVTYEMGDNTVSWPAPLTSSTGTSSGMGFFLKAGWDFGLIYAAVDADLSKPTFKNSSVNYSAEADSALYGALVGVNLPLGFRVWGGYVLDGFMEPAASNGYQAAFKQANGMKLGAGWKFLLVSFNLEYLDLQYKDSKITELAGVGVNQSIDDMKNKMYLLSVSIPFSL